MAVKKKGLGKGLDSLIPDNKSIKSIQPAKVSAPKKEEKIKDGVLMMKTNEVEPNREQPRKNFDEDALLELADSIKQFGVLQPLLVRKRKDYYEIIAGERRWRAAKMAGVKEVPVIIKEYTDQEILEIGLIENIQREDLNAIEEAQAYHTMMEKLHLTQNELANRIGKSRTHITNTLRLLNLPEKIQEYVLDGSLSMGHARALITLDKEKALKIAKRVIDEKLSVRDVENIVKGFELQEARKNKPKVEKPKEYQYVEGLLRKKYRTRIKVDDKSITIKYTDTQDLNRLLELMGVIEES